MENLVKKHAEELEKAFNLLKGSENQLQTILNGSRGIIFIKDLTGRFTLINKKLEKMLGITCDEIGVKTEYDIFSPSLANYYQIHSRGVLVTGVPEQMGEVTDPVDGYHAFLANKFPLYDLQGKPYAICGMSVDITERKKAEKIFKVLKDCIPGKNIPERE